MNNPNPQYQPGHFMQGEMPPETHVLCGDCGWTGTAKDVEVSEHVLARVGVGSPMPAGDCPGHECGALVYPAILYTWDDGEEYFHGDSDGVGGVEKDILDAMLDNWQNSKNHIYAPDGTEYAVEITVRLVPAADRKAASEC